VLLTLLLPFWKEDVWEERREEAQGGEGRREEAIAQWASLASLWPVPSQRRRRGEEEERSGKNTHAAARCARSRAFSLREKSGSGVKGVAAGRDGIALMLALALHRDRGRRNPVTEEALPGHSSPD